LRPASMVCVSESLAAEYSSPLAVCVCVCAAFWVALRSKTATALETLVKRYPTAQIYTVPYPSPTTASNACVCTAGLTASLFVCVLCVADRSLARWRGGGAGRRRSQGQLRLQLDQSAHLWVGTCLWGGGWMMDQACADHLMIMSMCGVRVCVGCSEPRVGDPTFASFANSRVGQFMRMTVCVLPLVSGSGSCATHGLAHAPLPLPLPCSMGTARR
jgi:hypothetical protein